MKGKKYFEFRADKETGLPAIWLGLDGRDIAVNPFSLYNIFWDCSRKNYFGKGISAYFLIFPDKVYGCFNDDARGLYRTAFDREDFIGSALQALGELCGAVLQGERTAYRAFGKVTAENIMAGLKDLSIPGNYSQIKETEIEIERFSFKFLEPFSCDTPYGISVGRRSYSSFLSDWTTDFNMTRIGLERFLLDYETEIKLCYEDVPTIIRLENQILFTQDYRVSDKDIVKVSVIPDGFSKKNPNLYGWCDRCQLASALYLGLLEICITETDWFDRECYGSWDDYRLATYNKLQSCIIENCIKGNYEDEFSFMPRQRVVCNTDEMKRDYKHLKETLQL